MKKFVCTALVFFLSVTASFAAAKDFIVLLDTSEGMFDNYDKLVRNYFPEVVKDHLKARDVFHLISFAEQPELELSQKIDTKSDMEVVLKRILLLQPLAKYSDTLLAFRFLYQYTLSLPSYQAKTIVIFTNGVYRPSPAQAVKKTVAQKEIESILQQVKSKGWDVRLVQLTPSPAANASGSSASEDQLSLSELAGNGSVPLYQFKDEANFSNLTLGSPRVTFPQDLGKIGTSFSFTFGIENPREASVLLRVRELLYNGENILKERSVIAMSSKETKSVSLSAGFNKPPVEGPQTATFALKFDDDTRAYPTESQIRFEYSSGWEAWLVPAGIVLGILVLAALALGAIVLIRKGYEHGKRVADSHVQKTSLALNRNEDESRPKAGVLISEKESETAQYVRSSGPQRRSVAFETSTSPRDASVSLSERESSIAGIKREDKAPELLQATAPRSNERDELLGKPQRATNADELFGKAQRSTESWEQLTAQSTTDTKLSGKKEILESRPRTQEVESILASAKKPSRDAESATTSAPKKDYDLFLKAAEKEPKKSNLGSPVRRALTPVKIADVNAPVRDFRMLVWTSDLVFQNMLQGANILSFKPGDRKTVGSAKAHFKILLASVGDAIAEVIYDGEKLTFVPLVPELFPGIENPIDSCVGTEIVVQVTPSKSIHLSFEKFVSKTEITNRILTGQATLEEKSQR